MSGETVLGRDSEGRVRVYDLATQQELDVGGGVPTLAAVLAAGNDPAGNIISSTGVDFYIADAGAGDPGQAIYIAGGAGDAGAQPAAAIQFQGGLAGAPGKIEMTTGGSTGSPGDVLTSDGSRATWQPLVTTTASTPVGGGLTSPLVADTTAKKLYAWDAGGEDYFQIGDWT